MFIHIVGVLLVVAVNSATVVSPYNPHSQYYSMWPKPIPDVPRAQCSQACVNGTINDYHCCPKSCKSCGSCTGLWNEDSNCCWATIQSNAYITYPNMICSSKVGPPCIINATAFNCDPVTKVKEIVIPDWANVSNWPFSVFVGVMIVLGLIALFILYSACCFGYKRPPIPREVAQKCEFNEHTD